MLSHPSRMDTNPSKKPTGQYRNSNEEIYTKREVMIPMRDGIKLYTAVYEPKRQQQAASYPDAPQPLLCSPYGEGFDRHFRTNLKNYIEHRYIIVFQDVRGRHKSEGIFIQVRPLNKNKKGKKDKKNIDEATDTYDTIEAVDSQHI